MGAEFGGGGDSAGGELANEWVVADYGDGGSEQNSRCGSLTLKWITQIVRIISYRVNGRGTERHRKGHSWKCAF